jgi:hypothetical protein
MSETTKEGWVNEFNPNKNQNSEEIFNLINENLKSLAEDNIEITKAEKYFEETI